MAKVKMIWAQDLEGKLGSGDAMLWHVPADFTHFKRSTLGFPIIMGRKSWEALGASAPLPKRRNIVISRNPNFIAEGGEVASSLEAALENAASNEEIVWIVGGSTVYEAALPYADELVVSYLDLNVDTDGTVVYAPEIDLNTWEVDELNSDTDWQAKSGDARWKKIVYKRR